MITKYIISKPEKYISKGIEKTFWSNVGTLTEFIKKDGSISRVVEIPAIGLKAQVFKIEPKIDTQKKPTQITKKEQGIVPTEVDYPENDLEQPPF